MRASTHTLLYAAVLASVAVISCKSVKGGLGDAKGFWESEEAHWAREFVVGVMQTEPSGDEQRKPVQDVSFLVSQRVAASGDGSMTSATQGAERLTTEDRGQIQSFDVGKTAGGSMQVVYNVFTIAEKSQLPNGTEIWAFDPTKENERASRINLGGPNFRLSPTIGDDGLIYFTTNEFGGLVMARMNENGRLFEKIDIDKSDAFPEAVKTGRLVYSATLTRGRTEIRVAEAAHNYRRMQGIGEGLQPRLGEVGSGNLFFVSGGAIWRASINEPKKHHLVIARPTSKSGDKLRGFRPSLKDPAISPDGKRIAYASNEAQVGKQFNYDIYVADIDGNNSKPRTRLVSTDDQPRWLDNKTLIFRSNRGLEWGLWKVPAQTSTQPDQAPEQGGRAAQESPR